MENYRNDFIAAYNDNNELVDYDYIYGELKETEFLVCLKATETNIVSNERKIKFYRYFLDSLIISTGFLAITLFINIFFDKT
jgi:ABC-type glycerol-3-phosphate transport system permease component